MQKTSGEFESMRAIKGPKNSLTWFQKPLKLVKLGYILIKALKFRRVRP